VLEDGSITQSAGGVGSNLKIKDGSPFWHQEEAEPIPPEEKFVPPAKVQVKFLEVYSRLIIPQSNV